MKKRNVRVVALLIVLCVAACIFAFVKINSDRSNINQSRRDEGRRETGAIFEELDEGLIGPGASASTEISTEEKTNQLLIGSIEGNVNNPVSDEVQVVRKVAIPQAVIIGDGDAASFYDNDEFSSVIPVDIDSFAKKDIPESYDSRNVNGKRFVSEVQNQGYSYLCWAFSSLGAVEGDILSHHDNISYKDLNLSEKHIAYYNMHRAEGSLGGLIDDDYRELVNADNNANDWKMDYDTGYISCGGVMDYCISLLTAWKGPVAEKGTDAFESIFGSTYVFTDNTSKPSDAYCSEYHVQGAYEIPGNIQNNTLIKQMVMEHGAVAIGVTSSEKYFKNHNSNLYSTFDGEKAKTADHEVLIIGWDDNYSASNFRLTPEGDGAWICKNSWGENSGEGGFFYLSYYDETAAVSSAIAYDVAAPGDDNWFDNNYQAAGFMTNIVSCMDDEKNSVYALSGSVNPYGMLYEAASSEKLKAVGLLGIDMYQQYEISIYVDPPMSDKEVYLKDANPVLTEKVSAISGGFHTFELEEDIPLSKGYKFFILVRPVTSSRLVFEQKQDSIGEANFDEWQNFTGNVRNSYAASGCSYYISDDAKAMTRQDDKDFFVKAYTVDAMD